MNIWLRKGEKKTFKPQKVNRYTHTRTNRLIGSIGPEGRSFENNCLILHKNTCVCFIIPLNTFWLFFIVLYFYYTCTYLFFFCFFKTSPLFLYFCIKPENVVAETDSRLARGELLGKLPGKYVIYLALLILLSKKVTAFSNGILIQVFISSLDKSMLDCSKKYCDVFRNFISGFN